MELANSVSSSAPPSKVLGRDMWRGRFQQRHTPARPCSQPGPLLLLPRGCGAPMGHAHLAPNLSSPGSRTQPLSLLPCSGLNASSKKVLEQGAAPSVLLAHPRAACSSLHRDCRRQGRRSPGLCPQVLVGHPNLWDSRGSSAPASTVEMPRAVLMSSEGRWDTGDRSQGGKSGG